MPAFRWRKRRAALVELRLQVGREGRREASATALKKFGSSVDRVKRSLYCGHMDTKAQIISSAERAFDHHGFAATGMDRLTEAAEVSSRTLYKHVGSKTALITAVLEERGRRFFRQFDVHSVDALFAVLESWTRIEGARGCLFLRALGETGGEIAEVSDAVAVYRRKIRDLIDRVVATDIDQGGSDVLAGQILVIFEGAISAASYRGVDAIRAARAAAAILVEYATSNPKHRDRNRSSRS